MPTTPRTSPTARPALDAMAVQRERDEQLSRVTADDAWRRAALKRERFEDERGWGDDA